MTEAELPSNYDDLPLAKEIADMLTLEIRRFLKERQGDHIPPPSDNVLALVSHELKTPVASLKTILQVLKYRMEGDPKKFNFADNVEYLDFSLREIDRLTVLVNDLLDFNKLNRGALQFNFANIDVQPVVAATTERMRLLCHTHTIIYSGDVSCIVKLDALRFEQVLTNLFTNAIKYSPHGSTITVKVSATKDNAVVTIHDNGAGISVADQARLFEPYYRTPTAAVSSIGGMGIGLYISKQIIEAHHGTITIASVLGKGTTVLITLPRAEPSAEITHSKA